MPQTKSHGKTAERKRAEIRELEMQMMKAYLCGTCHIGFDKQQDYEDHNETEEHNYHIARKIGTLVPGLAFCAACSCLVQTQYGWESHVLTDKHQRVKQSLKKCGIDGEYDEPLGCSAPGQIGMPISPSEIDMKRATTYGYGHGGKMGAGIPIIGLDSIHSLMKSAPTQHANLMEKFTCRVCMETFTFELRGNHLGSNEHWLNYLRRNYPSWYSKVMEISPEFVIQIKFKLMFYAHKIEEREKPCETPTASALRERFSIQATQRKSHNIGKDRNERGHYPRPKFGEVVFVKDGEKDVAKYIMRRPNDADVKKDKNGKAWHQKKDKEYLNNFNDKYVAQGWTKSSEGASESKDKFNQGIQMGSSEAQPTSSEEAASDERTEQDSAKDPIVTVERPVDANKTGENSKKRQHVNLSYSSSDNNKRGHWDKRGGPRRGFRGGPRGGPRDNYRGGVKGGFPEKRGPRNANWDGYQEMQYFEDGYHQPYAGEGYGYDATQGPTYYEEYGYGYDYGASDPYYGGPAYGYDQEFSQTKRHCSKDGDYYEVETTITNLGPRVPGPGRGRGGSHPPRGRGEGFTGLVSYPPIRGSGPPTRGIRYPTPPWDTAPRARGRGSRRPY